MYESGLKCDCKTEDREEPKTEEEETAKADEHDNSKSAVNKAEMTQKKSTSTTVAGTEITDQSTKSVSPLSTEKEQIIVDIADVANSPTVVLHTFIAFTTFAECTFDVVQGTVLILGMQYEAGVDMYVVVGTWIGFTDEALDFSLDTLATIMDRCSSKTVMLYCGFLSLVALSEQILAIIAAAKGLNQYGAFVLVAIIPCCIVLLFTVVLLFYWFRTICKDVKLEGGSGLPSIGQRAKLTKTITDLKITELHQSENDTKTENTFQSDLNKAIELRKRGNFLKKPIANRNVLKNASSKEESLDFSELRISAAFDANFDEIAPIGEGI